MLTMIHLRQSELDRAQWRSDSARRQRDFDAEMARQAVEAEIGFHAQGNVVSRRAVREALEMAGPAAMLALAAVSS